jgi:hypothetical protein
MFKAIGSLLPDLQMATFSERKVCKQELFFTRRFKKLSFLTMGWL